MQPELSFDDCRDLRLFDMHPDFLSEERQAELVEAGWLFADEGEAFVTMDASRNVDEMEATHPEAVVIDLGDFCEARCPHCNGELSRPTRLGVVVDRHGEPLWALALRHWSLEEFNEALRRFYGSTHVG